MADLAALQAGMAGALLAGRFDRIEAHVEPGPIPAEEALGVHRGTALGGLVNALRISHPTVLALVGEDFFDQAARSFIDNAPPSSAWLTGYGEGFAGFLAAYDLAQALPYLADVARFDFAVELVAGLALGLDGAAADLGQACLTLDASLRLVALDYPAAYIRDALDEDEAQLARLDMRPRRHVLALWRLPDGAGLRLLTPFPAAFLEAVLQGRGVGGLEAGDDELSALRDEVFSAPFARLSLKTAQAQAT
jgi:hypothetical protein